MLPIQSSDIWHQLHLACSQRDHGWRTPVLASIDREGFPNARTIVLREVDPVLQEMVFFSDQRSPKVQELQCQSRAMLVFWCAQLQWQLRAAVSFEILTNGDRVNRCWSRLQHSAAASDYLQPHAPGSMLTPPPYAESNTPPLGIHQLCLLVATVHQLDWLALSRKGHRRIRFKQNHAQELVP